MKNLSKEPKNICRVQFHTQTNTHNPSPNKYILVFISLPFVDGSLTVKPYLPQKLPKWTKLYVHRSLLLLFFKWDTLWPDGFNFSLKKKNSACRNLDLKVYTYIVTKKSCGRANKTTMIWRERGTGNLPVCIILILHWIF